MRTFSIIAVATLVAIGTPVQAQQVMRIGLVTINDAQHAFAQKYGEELGKRTKGAIKVEVFPAGQLGSIPREIENLTIGAQAGFVSPPGFFSGINRNFEVPDAPGIYKGFWHAHNAVTDPEFRNKYLVLGEKQGIVGAAIYTYGTTSIASLKPIRTLDDMKGLKIRVLASKMESKLASVLGMTGVPMPYGDVLPALQQNTIDGCRTAIAVMASSKFFTVTKPITVIEDGMIFSGLWLSKPWLAKLSPTLRDEVMKTGRDLETWAGHTAAGYSDRAEKLWKDNGGEVLRLSPKDQAEVMKRLAPLGEEFLAKDAATKDLYGVLVKVLARTSPKAPK